MKALAILFSVFLVMTACTKEVSQYEKAKAELETLIGGVIKLHEYAINIMSESTNINDMIVAIQNATDSKKGINSGIDKISQRYPNLNQEEVDKILTYMGERVNELNRVSDLLIQTVDSVIRENLADQAKVQPLIVALQAYQTASGIASTN